jgi:hypothetical protein
MLQLITSQELDSMLALCSAGARSRMRAVLKSHGALPIDRGRATKWKLSEVESAIRKMQLEQNGQL